jgi:MOSC domain-containing protein YiiM
MRGAVEAIHLVGVRGRDPEPVQAVVADAGRGLRGDCHHELPDTNDITLIEGEALERLATEHGVTLRAGESRRNVTTRGLDLGELVGRRFRVGEVVCEGIERCEPCARLRRLTGEPRVLRGLAHTGLEAAIVEGGTFRVGDAVEPLHRSDA